MVLTIDTVIGNVEEFLRSRVDTFYDAEEGRFYKSYEYTLLELLEKHPVSNALKEIKDYLQGVQEIEADELIDEINAVL